MTTTMYSVRWVGELSTSTASSSSSARRSLKSSSTYVSSGRTMTTTKLSPSTRRRRKFNSEHLCSEAVKEPSSNVSASFDELDPEQHIFKSADDEEQACTIQELMVPVAQDLDEMTANLKNVIGRKNPLLIAAADQIFGAGGKRLRPVLVLLVARATAALMKLPDINAKHRRIAEITEMLHTASLVHDDVLDECDVRRGSTTINCLYGTRVAVLAGSRRVPGGWRSWKIWRLLNSSRKLSRISQTGRFRKRRRYLTPTLPLKITTSSRTKRLGR